MTSIFRSLGSLLCFVGFWALVFGFLAGAVDSFAAVWLLIGGAVSAVIGLIFGLLAEIPEWAEKRQQSKVVPRAPLPLVRLGSAGSTRWRSSQFRRQSRRRSV